GRVRAQANIQRPAVRIRKGADIRDNRIQFPAALSRGIVKLLDDAGTGLPRFLDVIELRRGLAVAVVRAGARKVIAEKKLFQRLERDLVQKNLGGAVAHPKTLAVVGITPQPVRVRALEAVHAARVLRLGAI